MSALLEVEVLVGFLAGDAYVEDCHSVLIGVDGVEGHEVVAGLAESGGGAGGDVVETSLAVEVDHVEVTHAGRDEPQALDVVEGIVGIGGSPVAVEFIPAAHCVEVLVGIITLLGGVGHGGLDAEVLVAFGQGVGHVARSHESVVGVDDGLAELLVFLHGELVNGNLVDVVTGGDGIEEGGALGFTIETGSRTHLEVILLVVFILVEDFHELGLGDLNSGLLGQVEGDVLGVGEGGVAGCQGAHGHVDLRDLDVRDLDVEEFVLAPVFHGFLSVEGYEYALVVGAYEVDAHTDDVPSCGDDELIVLLVGATADGVEEGDILAIPESHVVGVAGLMDDDVWVFLCGLPLLGPLVVGVVVPVSPESRALSDVEGLCLVGVDWHEGCEHEAQQRCH